MKNEQATIVYAQGYRWTSYDGIKNHMVTTNVKLNSSKSKEEYSLLRIGLSRAISRGSINFSLKSLLSLFKMERSSKDGEQLHKRCSWITFNLFLSIFAFFSGRPEMPKCSQVRTFKWRLVFP